MADQKHQIGYIIHESTMESKPNVINEDGKRVVAEAVMQDADNQNRNGRCYRQRDLQREINCPRTKELITFKNLKGELSHPTDPSIARQQTIDGKLCCFRMDKLWMDGNLVKAIVRGTNNDYGEEFDEDLREGETKAFSLRALGSIVTENGRNYVDNLRLITYDCVIYASHPCAHTTKIISESGDVVNYTKTESGLLIPITTESVISYVKSESANLKNVFNTFDTLCESMAVINRGKDVQMITKSGDMLVINLESYIQNEIMEYCNK